MRMSEWMNEYIFSLLLLFRFTSLPKFVVAFALAYWRVKEWTWKKVPFFLVILLLLPLILCCLIVTPISFDVCYILVTSTNGAIESIGTVASRTCSQCLLSLFVDCWWLPGWLADWLRSFRRVCLFQQMFLVFALPQELFTMHLFSGWLFRSNLLGNRIQPMWLKLSNRDRRIKFPLLLGSFFYLWATVCERDWLAFNSFWLHY